MPCVPPVEFGGAGAQVYFLHANGYPPACYKPLLTDLAEDYRVTAILQRPLWSDSQPGELEDWHPLSTDLLDFLDAYQPAPCVCVGHSMGGIALLRAALRAPQRFKALVLLDPVLFPVGVIHLWRVIRTLGMEQRFHPLVPVANHRRRQFDSLELLFRGYRRKPIFRQMSDDSLRAYVEGIACPAEHGYRLCYSAEWESRIYTTSAWRDLDIWRALPGLVPPTLILRGQETDTFWRSTARRVRRRQTRIRIETIAETTHLLPLERPHQVAERIKQFLKEVL